MLSNAHQAHGRRYAKRVRIELANAMRGSRADQLDEVRPHCGGDEGHRNGHGAADQPACGGQPARAAHFGRRLHIFLRRLIGAIHTVASLTVALAELLPQTAATVLRLIPPR